MSDLGSLKVVEFNRPVRNLSTTTSTEIQFEGEHLAVNLHQIDTSVPPASSPPAKRKHKKHSNSRPPQFTPAGTDMHLFEGGDTWEDIEEMDKTWIIPMDGNSP
jgi:hypothetical protein